MVLVEARYLEYWQAILLPSLVVHKALLAHIVYRLAQDEINFSPVVINWTYLAKELQRQDFRRNLKTEI